MYIYIFDRTCERLGLLSLPVGITSVSESRCDTDYLAEKGSHAVTVCDNTICFRVARHSKIKIDYRTKRGAVDSGSNSYR